MSQLNGALFGGKKISSHDWLWRLLLLPLLLAVLILGLYVTLCRPEQFPYLLGVGGFSIAYAIHFFAVSIALCGIYIREKEEYIFRELWQKEYRVVTSAMCSLAGGLGIILAGGLCAVGSAIAIWVYVAAGTLLFVSVLKYVLRERRWPREAREILYNIRPGAEQPAQPRK
jgi:hypothetical protein